MIQFLTIVNFVSQPFLEITLFSLAITDRGRLIRLEDFYGQLEGDWKNGLPYWNLSLKTTALITKRRLASTVSNELFPHTKGIDKAISICSTDTFAQLKRNNLLSLSNSDWYSGYFSQTILSVLEKEEVRKSIEARPEKYKKLLPNLWK